MAYGKFFAAVSSLITRRSEGASKQALAQGLSYSWVSKSRLGDGLEQGGFPDIGEADL